MATVTVVKALTNYFNTGDAKWTAKEWLTEMKALTPDEKRKLAELVCAETGDTLSAMSTAKPVK
jgi:hypothetical protein